MHERETGDRAAFLGRIERRLAQGIPENPVHPAPAPTAAAPPVIHLGVDANDLVGTFERTATAAAANVHRLTGDDDLTELVGALVARYDVREAITSAEPIAEHAGDVLRAHGVTVSPYDRATGARAQLGVTGAVAAIAATGSVVVDSRAAGGRGASLLPAVHLCLVEAGQLVASPSEVLRPLGASGGALPSNLVIISGPSRTGDIEQILTLGVHGPIAVHIAISV
jgi:L-lactate dehydrogenase complex protein LldG